MFLISQKTHDPKTEAAWRKSMAEGRIQDPKAFAAFMLAKTSRTFALNIQVLPAGLRRQVLLAYLFCRMADTLEDDGELLEPEKIRLLDAFRGLFPPASDKQARLESFRTALPAEWATSDRWDRLLVHHCDWIYPQLSDFSGPVVAAVSRCVEEMCQGMIDFTRRQAATGNGQALIGTIEDLDRYCYYVAGTVGNLLCDLFALHSPLIGAKRAKALRALSVSFGLGLQLTNILKDVQEDRRRNVSYIPSALLAEENLTVDAFLASESQGSAPAAKRVSKDEAAAARVMSRLLRKARAHLQDALDYSCLLPRLEPRLRLFCLWPLFMAVENLALMGENLNGFQGEGKLKITRKQVKDIVGSTSLACWSNLWLRSMFRKSLAKLDAGLARTPAGAPSLSRPAYAAAAPEQAANAVSGAAP